MPTGEDYISRFCSGLGLDAEVEAKAYELIKAAQEKELTSGRGQRNCSLDYLHSSVLCESVVLKRGCRSCYVTEVIKNRYKELIQNLNIGLDI